VLTAIAGLALLSRFGIKSWIRWALPRVSSPGRVWGLEDFFYAVAYGFDLAHILFVQRSYQSGLGRHLWFLSPDELRDTLRNEFISQPLAVFPSMLSRTGMMCFLYSCFNGADKQIRVSILVCMGVQIIINMVTVVQIIVQCGPDPYHSANRILYFHYLWDDLPSDGSVICHSPSVQTIIGFVQGGFNSSMDLFLTALSAIQLWRFPMRATDRGPSHSESLCSRLKRIPRASRHRRLWQTCVLSGPLLLSGIASIIKTWVSGSMTTKIGVAERFLTDVSMCRIENYSILLATCAPIIRLLVSNIARHGSPSNGPG
ncbi:uncharacterized protein BP01DRAFT_308404, partial [Aspergillus saccharolyticus JOP 1030-1]